MPLGQELCNKSIANDTKRETYLKHFYYETDNSSDKSLYKSMDFTVGVRTLIDNLAFIAPPVNGADIYLMEKLLDEYGVSDVQKVYDPSFGGYIFGRAVKK